MLLFEANPSICTGVPALPAYSRTRISLQQFSLPLLCPCVHTHTHTQTSPVFKNTSLDSTYISNYHSVSLSPSQKNSRGGATIQLSLVALLPFLLEPAPIRLLSPPSTETAITKATRSSLWPNSKANPRCPSGLTSQQHRTQLSPPPLVKHLPHLVAEPSLSVLRCHWPLCPSGSLRLLSLPS